MKLVKLFIFLTFYISKHFFLGIRLNKKKKEKSIKTLLFSDFNDNFFTFHLYRILFIQLLLEEISLHFISAFLLLNFLIKNINICYVYSVNTIFKRSYFLLYSFIIERFELNLHDSLKLIRHSGSEFFNFNMHVE